MSMYMQNAQKRKVKKFESALKSFDRYKVLCERLLAEDKITEAEFKRRLAKRAEMLDL